MESRHTGSSEVDPSLEATPLFPQLIGMARTWPACAGEAEPVWPSLWTRMRMMCVMGSG